MGPITRLFKRCTYKKKILVHFDYAAFYCNFGFFHQTTPCKERQDKFKGIVIIFPVEQASQCRDSLSVFANSRQVLRKNSILIKEYTNQN